MLDTRLLDFRLLTGARGTLVELVPLVLPVAHLVFGSEQRLRRLFFGRLYHLQVGHDHFQLGLKLGHFLLVGRQQPLRLVELLLGAGQIRLQLGITLAGVGNALLETGNVPANRVKTSLHFIEGVGQLVMCNTLFFDAGIAAHLPGNQFLDGQFQLADLLLFGLGLVIQVAVLEGLQVRLVGTLFLFEAAVLFRCGGLAFEARELAVQLIANIGETLEVFLGATHAVFGIAAALLVLGDARRFLDKYPQLFRLGLDQLGDHALLDDGVTAWTETGTQEQVGHVATAALLTVQVVVVLAIAGYPALDRDLGKGRILARQLAFGIVEHQLDRCLAHRFAAAGTIEDDVRHGVTAQVLRRGLTHYPTHGVNGVGLTTAIGADHGAEIGGEVDGGRVDEGLEPGQLDALQTHGLETR